MTSSSPRYAGIGMVDLARDLCEFATGVVADANEPLFERLCKELPFEIMRWRSGDTYNGWVVPDNWRVERATISRNGTVVFDGQAHTLGVARLSRSFHGSLTWEELQPHLVTDAELPDAYVFHCMWQYRPWGADWALAVPYETYRALGPGEYEVDLETVSEPGEMLLGVYDHPGETDRTVVFHSNSCHPHMANDGFAGTAVLLRLFQMLRERSTFYSYRLIVGPEHVGTVFYLRDMPPQALQRIVCGVFAEMPGTGGPMKAASTFLGGHRLDRAFANALRHHSQSHALVPWRQGAGNDETVWEAPGYEVPFVEVTRSESFERPYTGYHTSLDNPDLMDPGQLEEFALVLDRVVDILERDVVMHRTFDGLVCLSNPQYDLYMERPDPSVDKQLAEDSEAWGQLLDCLLRYFDGTWSVLEVAERHGLPFAAVRDDIGRFEEAGLVRIERCALDRPVPRRMTAAEPPR